MLRGIFNAENNCDLRIKAFDTQACEISFSVEYQSVSAALDRLTHQKERLYAPVGVGRGVTKLGPAFIRVLNCKRHSNATGRRAARDVENVRRDGAHGFVSGQLDSKRRQFTKQLTTDNELNSNQLLQTQFGNLCLFSSGNAQFFIPVIF